MVFLPDRGIERLFPAVAGGEMGLEEVERTEAVRGCGEQDAHDAADRHGTRQGYELQEARGEIRQGRRGVLQGIQRRHRQAVRAGRALSEQGGGSHDVEDVGGLI